MRGILYCNRYLYYWYRDENFTRFNVGVETPRRKTLWSEDSDRVIVPWEFC